MGFSEVLLLIFITLKLMGIIDWSWWWVMSPLWVSLFVAALAVIAVLKNRKMFR
tara:strand:- start:10567 stop:10728 length:162 start_codon:yes stop_codon:yes gene_type:complete